MTNRENVIAAVRGEPVDRVPAGFWLHFPEDCFYGEQSVQAHLKFFRESGTDIMKIMNENVFPCDIPIREPADWGKIRPFGRTAPFIQDQLEITKRILDQVHDQGVVLLTVHGLVASAWHARGGTAGYERGHSSFLTDHLRRDPKAVKQAYEAITETLCVLTEEALKAGVDGVRKALRPADPPRRGQAPRLQHPAHLQGLPEPGTLPGLPRRRGQLGHLLGQPRPAGGPQAVPWPGDPGRPG